MSRDRRRPAEDRIEARRYDCRQEEVEIAVVEAMMRWTRKCLRVDSVVGIADGNYSRSHWIAPTSLPRRRSWTRLLARSVLLVRDRDVREDDRGTFVAMARSMRYHLESSNYPLHRAKDEIEDRTWRLCYLSFSKWWITRIEAGECVLVEM